MNLPESYISHLINIGFKDEVIVSISNHLDRNHLYPVSKEPFGLIATENGTQYYYWKETNYIYGRYFRDYDLQEDTGAALVAYTDGSGVTTDKAVGCAAIIRGPNTHLDLNHTYGQGTNNIAELTGIYLALCAVYRSDIELTVYSDSEYSIGVLSKPWNPQMNKELIEEMRAMLTYRKTTFKHVKGHNGNELNELADKLAGQARIKE